MWQSIEKYLNQNIPQCIKEILSASGFNSEITIEDLKEQDLKMIEAFVNKNLRSTVQSLTCCQSQIYQSQKEFEFVPGHRKFILHLATQLRLKREQSVSINDLLASKDIPQQIREHPSFSCLLKEFVSNSMNNFNKAPSGRRYTDIVQAFSTYIYMICGRNCYEIISSNLPMPQASTICMQNFSLFVCKIFPFRI